MDEAKLMHVVFHECQNVFRLSQPSNITTELKRFASLTPGSPREDGMSAGVGLLHHDKD